MSDWQERITRDTVPAIRVEHELRYCAAAPLIRDARVWADLGCGNGIAPAEALAGAFPEKVILADLDAAAVACAARELRALDAVQLAVDLTDAASLASIGQALLAGGGPRVVTCFEVVEHLSTFVPLLEWSTQLARENDVTFVLSVPNDAFWSLQNPHHRTIWGEGAFDQLQQLLPAQRTLLRQVALSGSALADWGDRRAGYELHAEAGGTASVATHFIAAFGPRHGDVDSAALVAQTDTLAQRRWERERESNLAIAEAKVLELSEQVRANAAEFEAWRTYINELERELGHPLSGRGEDRPA